MATLPDVDQQKSPVPSATGSIASYRVDTRAASIPAQQTKQLGAALQEKAARMELAEARIRTKEEALYRAKAKNAAREYAASELRSLMTEDDFTAPETMTKYSEKLNKKFSELLQAHKGSPESYVSLVESLDEIRSQYFIEAGAKASAAQDMMIDRLVGQDIRNFSAKAYKNPGKIIDLVREYDKELSDKAAAMPAHKQELFKQQGRSALIQNAAEALIVSQRYGDVGQLFEIPGISESLSPEAQRKITSQVETAKMAYWKERTKAITDLQGEIAAYVAVHGRYPPSEILHQMQGLTPPVDANARFEDLKRKNLDFVMNNLLAVEQGLVDESTHEAWKSALIDYIQPLQNPDTREYRYPKVSRRVAEVAESIGLTIPRESIFGAGPSDVERAFGEEDRGEMTDDPYKGQTVWRMSGFLAGPIDAAQATLGKTPIIGELFRDPEQAQARNYVSIIQSDLISALQRSRYFAEGERKYLLNLVSISPETFKSDAAYMDKLISIDRGLSEKQNDAYVVSISDAVGKEERKRAELAAIAIAKFREKLGVPPVMPVGVSEEQQRAWLASKPEGSVFIAPDGRPYVVDRTGQFKEEGKQ